MSKQSMINAIIAIAVGVGLVVAAQHFDAIKDIGNRIGLGNAKTSKEVPNTNEMRQLAMKKIKEIEAQLPIVRGHVQALQTRELAAKYAEFGASDLISESKWPCTFAGVRIESRGDAYRTLIAIEDKHKKIKAELNRFLAAQAALMRIQDELDDKIRTLDLVDAHAAVIDAHEFVKDIEKIKIPALPSEPAATIDLPAIDLTAVK